MTLRSKIGSPLPVLLLAVCLGLFAGQPFCPLLSTENAQAQGSGEASVSAALPEPSVDAGEATQYQITVTNGAADKPPLPPMVNGLTIAYLGPSTQRSFGIGTNGQFVHSETVVYVYSVNTTRAGRFTIPGQDVVVSGTTLRTLPVTLTVQDAGAPSPTPPSQAILSELVIPKKTAYVGESFLAELRTYFGLNVKVFQIPDEPILNGEGFSVQKFTPPRPGSPVVDGIHYQAAIYRTAITGVKTGTLSIGPVDTMPTVQMPPVRSRRGQHSGGGGLFGDDDDDSPFNIFGGGMGARLQPPQQIKVTAPPVEVTILPLPAGQPANFSGGIGEFKLETEAQPRRAQVGDPVTVRLILTGKGNFSRINAPVLNDEDGLRTYPATAQFKADDDVGLSGTKTFEQVVVPNGPRASLPAYHFNYLDPATGKYVALDTAPVAVKIEGSAVPPPVVTTLSPPAANTPEATPTPRPHPAQDILYIRNEPGPMRKREAFLPVYRRPVFWWAQLAPLTALLLTAGYLVAKARGRNEAIRRQAALLRQRGELQRALRRDTTSRRDFYTAATRLAQLQAAAGRLDDQLSAAEIVLARRLDAQTANSVQEIFHRRDELAYSGGQVAQEVVPASERQTVLATLETLGKNPR